MISFDLETLGKRAGSVVFSIGVVEFNQHEILKEYQIFFDAVEQQEQYGLVAGVDTALWWFKQPDAARKAILAGQEGKVYALADGLDLLTKSTDWGSQKIWVNGASFDFPLLSALYDKVGMEPPWKFYNECCLRTLKNFMGKDAFDAIKVKPDLAHDALSDARAQALTLINILTGLKKAA